MKARIEKDLLLVGFLCLLILGVGIWGYFDWFYLSPQDVAEQRGLTVGKLESRSSDGKITLIFDLESIGRKRVEVYPGSWELIFVPDNKDYAKLFFEITGIKGCEKLTDQELIKQYLKKIEVHYSQ